MSKAFRFFAILALALACVLPVIAQTAANPQPAASELSIIIGERQIKFTPLKAYEQIRLEVFNNTSELLFDSGAIAEADLNYNLYDSNGQPLAPGLYAYTLSLKTPGLETPRKYQGHFILEKGNDQIWLTTKGESQTGAEVTGGALTVARTAERTTLGAGYLASGRSLNERAGLQRNTQGRALADKKTGVTREDPQAPLNISGSGTTNRHTKWLDGPNGVVGDSVIHETASGDLGIGTTAPGGVLDVLRSSPNPLIGRFWNTGTGPAQLRFVGGTGATSQFLITDTAEWLTSIAVNNSIGMQFRVRGVGTSNTEAQLNASAKMTILRNGNVGIGTTTPATQLHVLGRITTGQDFSSSGAITFRPPDGFAYFHIDNGPGGSRPVGRLRFSHGGNPGDVELMSITQEGNVGIGTAAPSAKLDVNGTGVVRARVNSDSNAGLRLALNEVNKWSLTTSNLLSFNRFHIYNEALNKDALTISASDNTFSIGSRVEANGNVYPGEDNTYTLGTHVRRWSSVWTTGGIIETSDARAKRDVTHLGYGLREVLQLRPVAYKWKDKADSRAQLGLLAQEVEPLIPEAVVPGETAADLLGLNYSHLVPVLIKAIQEQQSLLEQKASENAAQQQQITTLQQQNAALESRFNALEQLVQRMAPPTRQSR